MRFGDYLYIAAAILFAWMTFVIIRNYFRSKFNDKGQRLDMIDEEKNTSSADLDEDEARK